MKLRRSSPTPNSQLNEDTLKKDGFSPQEAQFQTAPTGPSAQNRQTGFDVVALCRNSRKMKRVAFTDRSEPISAAAKKQIFISTKELR